MICGSGGSKSRLAKAAGAEPAGQMRDENLHAVVARSTCRSQNVQECTKHTSSGPLLEVELSKKCRCGAKHVSKSKCIKMIQNVQSTSKHTILRPLLEVEPSKKCTPLWREAHFEVTMHKAHQVRTTFGS